MQKSIVIKKNVEVSRARKQRPIEIAQSLIPLARQNNEVGEITMAIFHKSMYGHVLIALNNQYQAVNAWSDVKGILPIKCRLIKNAKLFPIILRKLQPQLLYLNDAEILKPLPNECQLKPYHNRNLLDVINEIRINSKIVITPTPQITDSNATMKSKLILPPETAVSKSTNSTIAASNGKKQRANNSEKSNTEYKIPSFHDMKIMQPTITRKQYKEFKNKL